MPAIPSNIGLSAGRREGGARATRSASDDGAGAINGGTITYGTGAIDMPVLRSGDYQRYDGEAWSTANWTETLDGPLTVRYALAATVPGASISGAVDVPPLEIQLLDGVQDEIVPGTVRFTLGAKAYSDRDGNGGILYWADGTVVGTMDYAKRTAKVTNWTGATTSVAIQSLISTFGQFTLKELSFRTASAPLSPGSLQVVATSEDGDAVTGEGGTDGTITGTGITAGSTVEHDIGVVAMAFDAPVYPGTIRYSAVASTIIPLDPAIIGVDPVRLPPDGRVPILRAGDYAAIYEDGSDALPNPAVAGATYALSQQLLAFAYLEDGAGEQVHTLPVGLLPDQVIQIPTLGRTGPLEYAVLEDARARPIAGGLYEADLDAWTITLPATYSGDGYEEPFAARYLPLVHPATYTVDREAGEITMANPLDLTGYTQPLVARWRIHDLTLIVEAQTTGTVTLQAPLTHDYSTAGAVSALLLHGDLVARVANQFVENSQPAEWADYLQGSLPSGGANYDWTGYPVLVRNDGAIRERWRLKRRSDGQWDVIGETLGLIQIWAGTATLEAKRSPSQAVPYFRLYHEGLGSGWATGNIIQFETFAAQGPLWVLRSVRPGQATVATDAIRLRHRVGAD